MITVSIIYPRIRAPRVSENRYSFTEAAQKASNHCVRTKSTTSPLFLSALGLGLVAGLRSMTAPAIVSASARSGSLHLANSRLRFLATKTARNTFAGLAAGELIADKLPFTPNRTDAGPLVGRILSGGLCGATVAASERQSLALGSMVGGLAAVAGAYAGYQLRRRAVQQGHVPDFVVATFEDAIALLGGALAVKLISKERPEITS
jgi:uncharacterized membrane protein